MMQQEISPDAAPAVTLFGVGGAGGNAVGHLFRDGDWGMKILCANTDLQALRAAPSANQIQLGRRITGGLGAGAKPEIGRAAAEESMPEIKEALQGTSLCFVAAGLGGGTGTGAAPVIARAAREMGILTIGIATKPFAFEGARRARVAAAGIAELEKQVDALVVVCNQNLLRLAGANTTFRHALLLSDSVVCESATDFAALVAGPALKRLTLADLRATLKPGGRMVIGYGERCGGRDRAVAAARSALRSPLLEDAPQGAQNMLVTIAAGSDLGLFEIEEAMDYLRTQVHPSADLAWASVVDPSLEGRMRIGIAATGLPPEPLITEAPLPAAPAATTEKAPIPSAAKAVQFAPPPPMAPALMTPTPAQPERAEPASRSATAPIEGPEPAAPRPIFETVPMIRETPVTPAGVQDIPVLDQAAMREATPEAPPSPAVPCRTPSLADRIYFATRELKRSWHRQPVVPVLPAPPERVIRVTRGLPPHLLAG